MGRRIQIITFAIILNLMAGYEAVEGQGLSRDYNVDILVNQAGYLPASEKFCLVAGDHNETYEVVHIASRQVAFTGTFQPAPGDLGNYSAGNFSAVMGEGQYYIKSGNLRSYPFTISEEVYDHPMDLIVHYFSRQRCGASTTGFLSPCHMDDGIRMDNGKHQDVSGGWHDASDLRKWVSATIYGMIGLGKAYELRDDRDKEKILEELKWGNRYFLNMQEPQGYLMSYIGGDVQKHSDSNRWTDNIIGKEGGELHFAKPTQGSSTADMLIFGTNDDRVIKTDPLDMMGQYNFITAEALMARITKQKDPDYSETCLAAAISCFNWCESKDHTSNPGVIGASMQAALELYKTTGKEEYRDFAVSQASRLKELQAPQREGEVSGFFYSSPGSPEPYKEISRGCLAFISLCDLAGMFPSHRDLGAWKGMISNYSYNYLVNIALRNAFGMAPFGLYAEADPGGNRKAGSYWYRYFMYPNREWWVGINANLASAGVGLMKASKVFNDEKLRTYAQRQLDWIIGVNPFNSSTLIGVGHNHPRHFPGSTYYPQTPVIPGAVMNGLGGDRNDIPDIGDGNWQISEYWTPMVAYTLWLMAEMAEEE